MRKIKSLFLSIVLIMTITSSAFAEGLELNNFQDIRSYYDSQNIFFSSSVEELDFQAVKEVTLAMEEVMECYPQTRGIIQMTFAHDMGSMIMAVSGGGSLLFSEYYFDNYKRIERNSYSSDGFHPKNTTVKSHGYHEMGHILELYIVKNSNLENPYKDWVNFTTANEIVNDAIKQVKTYPKYKDTSKYKIIKEISEYATYTASETIAEAVSDYFTNGQESSMLSLAIIEQIEIRLDNIKTKNIIDKEK